MGVEYYQYIQSEEWRQRANEAKRRAGYRCRVCNRSSKEVVLNAHHRTYKRLGHEDPDDITVLCRDCHELFELNKKIPRLPQQQYQLSEVSINTDNPWKKAASFSFGVVAIGIATGILPLILVILWSSLKPSLNPSSTKAQPTITATSAPVVGAIHNVIQTGLVCGTPCNCAPVVKTITKGEPVTILETATCNGNTWYRIDIGEWIGPNLMESGNINTTAPAAVATSPSTLTYSGPSPDDCAKETNEEWANLCWDAIEDYYRDLQDDAYDYAPDYSDSDEPYDEPFDDERFVDGP